jgi:hypothetical protein
MSPREHIVAVSASERALRERLLGDLAATREGAPLDAVVALVRSNLVGLQLARRLADQTGGFANVRFLTFIDLASRLAEPEGRLPDGADRAIFAAGAAALPPDSYFGPVKDKPGFVEKLRAAAADVREAGLASWPAELNLGEKLTLVGRLYDEYRVSLARGRAGPYGDEYDLFASAAARAAAFDELFGAPDLFVYGFYDFNELQRRLLESLASSLRLRVYFPYRPGFPFRFAADTYKWLRGLGGREEEVEAPAAGGGPAVAAAWFGATDGVAAEGTTIVSAPDPEREAAEIAREAVRLHREHGVSFAEMAVLYRGDETRRALTEALEALPGEGEAGPPYFLAGGVPLAETRAGDGLRRGLVLASGARRGRRPFTRREVMDFVASAPLAPGGLAPEAEAFEPAVWDDISAAAGVTWGREGWERRLASYAAACEATPPEERRHAPAQVGALASFVARLAEDLARFPAEAAWADYASLAEDFIEEYFTAGPETEAVRELVGALASYDDLLPAAVPFERFRRLCERRLEEVKPGRGRFAYAGINLLPFDRARGLVFRAVFVPGLAEGVFPGRPPLDPILLDAERLEFNDRADGRWRFNLRGDRLAEEPLMFHLALDAAAEFLTLSYSRLDAAGRERLPSHFLLKAAGAAAGRSLGAENFEGEAEPFPWFRRVGASAAPPPAEALAEAEYWAGAAAQAGAAGVASYLAGAEGAYRATAEEAEARLSADFTRFDGRVASPAGRAYLARRFGGPTVRAAASELELLAACPRKYLFERLLKVRRWEEPEAAWALSPAARGLVVHEVLRRTLRAETEAGPEGEAAREAAVAAAVEEALREVAAGGEAPPPFVAEMERRFLTDKLVSFLRAEAGAREEWRPTYFELRFGRPAGEAEDAASTRKPFRLELSPEDAASAGPAAAEIHGRLDRVDLRGAGARVLDYKTGRRDNYVQHLAGGRQLQPVLYLMAYAALFGADVAASRAGYAFPLEESLRYKFLVDEKRRPEEATVRRLVGGWLALAREGIFPAAKGAPGGREPCEYCTARAACEAARPYLTEAKAASAEAARFLALRELK